MFALLGMNQAERQLSVAVVTEKRAAVCYMSAWQVFSPCVSLKKKVPITVSIGQVM